MRHAHQPELLRHVFGATVPMRGRMIHGRHGSGALYEIPQDYDIHGRVGLPWHSAADLPAYHGCPRLILVAADNIRY
jgi:hypothetical protein